MMGSTFAFVSQLFVVITNLTLSILLVVMNKALVIHYKFYFMTVLSTSHFMVSSLICMLGVLCGFIIYKPVQSYIALLKIALGSLLSIVFMNFCLANSSIGFYQVSKLGTIPMTIVLERVTGLRRQNLTLSLLLTLAIVMLGMFLVIQEEIVINSSGLIWAALGVTTTAAAQVYFSPLTRSLGLNSPQLLFHTAPCLTFGSFMIIPIFDNVTLLSKFDISNGLLLFVLLSSVVAVAFNISNYALLQTVSPLTYNLLGHLKTIIIIILGAYLFGNWPTMKMVIGIVMAIFGVVGYSQVIQWEESTKTLSLPTIINQQANTK